jgi:hypothetical protein
MGMKPIKEIKALEEGRCVLEQSLIVDGIHMFMRGIAWLMCIFACIVNHVFSHFNNKMKNHFFSIEFFCVI